MILELLSSLIFAFLCGSERPSGALNLVHLSLRHFLSGWLRRVCEYEWKRIQNSVFFPTFPAGLGPPKDLSAPSTHHDHIHFCTLVHLQWAHPGEDSDLQPHRGWWRTVELWAEQVKSTFICGAQDVVVCLCQDHSYLIRTALLQGPSNAPWLSGWTHPCFCYCLLATHIVLHLLWDSSGFWVRIAFPRHWVLFRSQICAHEFLWA